LQENIDRFMALSEYNVKGEATVKFKAGSAKISPEDEEKLKHFPQTATDLKGYIVEMMGYPDTTGSAAMNTTLSEERAKNGNQLFGPAGQVPVRRTWHRARWANTEPRHRTRQQQGSQKASGSGQGPSEQRDRR
jgi:flagellar motor protein MotB